MLLISIVQVSMVLQLILVFLGPHDQHGLLASEDENGEVLWKRYLASPQNFSYRIPLEEQGAACNTCM